MRTVPSPPSFQCIEISLSLRNAVPYLAIDTHTTYEYYNKEEDDNQCIKSARKFHIKIISYFLWFCEF